MNAPLCTGIEETDLPAPRQPEVPSVPPPMFTDIVPADIYAFRRCVYHLDGEEAAELVGFVKERA